MPCVLFFIFWLARESLRKIGMEKKIRLGFLLFTILLLGACSKNKELRAWVVTKNIVVYKDYRGDGQLFAFELTVGDVCVLGEQKNEKAYRYTEVLCPGRGYGWAADYVFAQVTRGNAASGGEGKRKK